MKDFKLDGYMVFSFKDQAERADELSAVLRKKGYRVRIAKRSVRAFKRYAPVTVVAWMEPK